MNARFPNASTPWQLWHSDTFDRDDPPSLQTTGMDIVEGLSELWRYTLKEGILDNGDASFSRFQLMWGATCVAILVNPFDNPALLKLRQWTHLMSTDQEPIRSAPFGEEQRETLLLRLAHLHYQLLQESPRWTASTIDWSAEARDLLARVESMSDPAQL